MNIQFANVKYSLYNSDSFQTNSDDEDVSDGSCSNLNSEYISRKIRFEQDTRIDINDLPALKSCTPEELPSQFGNQLKKALSDESLDILCLLLKSLSPEACKLKVNELDGNKRAPLHYAARYNQVKVAQLLIEKGADVNVQGEDGLTPLHFAARYGYNKSMKTVNDTDNKINEDGISVINVLLDGGAHVNCQDHYGMAPLHYAAIRGNTVATALLLKANNINTEIFDKQEMTALHCGANYKSPAVVKLLLEAKADPEAADENSSTPLHLAATTGSKHIVILLLEAVEKVGNGGDLKRYIDEKNSHGNTALLLAVAKGHLDIMEILLRKGANVQVTLENQIHPLHLAAISGNIDIGKCLLDHGAAVNCINRFGETPLHRASAFNSTLVIDFLIANGANIEQQDNAHFTPLLVAVAEGHVETIQKLLEANANVEVLDNMDRSVVFWAAQENHPQSLKVLLNCEKTYNLVNRCDHYDNSPLHIAALKGFTDIIKILLDHGAEIEIKNEHEQTPLHLAAKNDHSCVAQVLLKHSKVIVNAEDENANTPLHLAALSGHHLTVGVLLNAGANFEARNCYLWTALGCAASNGWKRCCQTLLKAGSCVDAVDKSKATPLHLAARAGHKSTVKLLLNHRANIAQCDKNGNNCLDIAIEKGHEDVAVEILSDSNWEVVLRNESPQNTFGVHQTPLRKLIQQMPDVAEKVLDKCILSNDFQEDHSDYEITFNYEFLDDTFACYKPFIYDSFEIVKPSSSSSLTSSCIVDDQIIYDDCGEVKKNAKPYTSDKEIIKFNHPLMLMVTHGREMLLSHPLCQSLLRRKWKYYGRYVYYCNLLVFVLFLTFLTGYVVTAIPPCPITDDVDPKCCSTRTCQPFLGNCNTNIEQTFPNLCRNFIYLLAVIHMLKEIYEIYQNGRRYINFENALEWFCYLSTLLFVADLNDCTTATGIRQVWQWELGSLSIFSAWMVLLMFISKFPFLGIYVIMFFQILRTFVHFSFVFFLFVVAFALGFYTLLQNQNPFESPGESLMKTSVMMIGEIEFDAIFNDQDNTLLYKTPTYALFIVFLIIMTVIIMNLLIGLAVDDIKGVQEKAELKRLAMKVELVLTVERILPVMALRKCLYKFRTIRPNAWIHLPWYWKCLKVNQTAVPSRQKLPLEKLEEKQAKLSKQVKELQDFLLQVQKDVKCILSAVKNKDLAT